jgi:hypothetical protein
MQNSDLTRQEIDQIKREVKAAAEPLMTGWAALDGNTAIKSFSPEMVSCYDTLLLDYESLRSEPRFKAVVDKLGLTEYYLKRLNDHGYIKK